MAVPDFQTLMLPVLGQCADGQEHAAREVRDAVATEFGLSNADRLELLPSGRQTRFGNRVAWALGYLKQAGLLESPRRGVYRATARGLDAIASKPSRIDISYLMRYPEFVAFRTRKGEPGEGYGRSAGKDGESESKELTPDEEVRDGYRRLREALSVELLDRLQKVTPRFFENVVVELLVAMGYGGTHKDAASVVGRSGDGGIDGIIKEDRLGLESIYIQAKRWNDNRTVGRPEIQQFAGALQGQKAKKGVFITTASFTREAIEYARSLQTTIVLMDGEELTELLLDYGIGVSTVETIKLLKVDEDYFIDE